MASSSSPIFTLTIPAMDAHPGGTLTLTSPSANIYLLTMDSPPDNRLTTPFLRTFLSALSLVRHLPAIQQAASSKGQGSVLLTTSAIPKFFSNGLDLQHATSAPGFWPLLYECWAQLLTFPMPTIAVMNGHTFAGGLMTAMAHDYRLAPTPRGYLCLNELEFGAPLTPAMAALFRVKIPSPATFRKIVLEAHRFTGPDAVKEGIADGLVSQGKEVEEAVQFVHENKLTQKSQTGVYAVLKAEMWKGLVEGVLRGKGRDAELARFDRMMADEEARKTQAPKTVEEWQAELDKAKAKL